MKGFRGGNAVIHLDYKRLRNRNGSLFIVEMGHNRCAVKNHCRACKVDMVRVLRQKASNLNALSVTVESVSKTEFIYARDSKQSKCWH